MSDGECGFAGGTVIMCCACMAVHVFIVIPYYRGRAVNNSAAEWSITEYGNKQFRWNVPCGKADKEATQ